LERAGFWVVSQKGSHETVIVSNHKEVALGTFRSILSQASLTLDEFEGYLR